MVLPGLWEGDLWFLGRRTQQGVAGCTLALEAGLVWRVWLDRSRTRKARQAAFGQLPPLSSTIVHGGLDFEEVLESGFLPAVS